MKKRTIYVVIIVIVFGILAYLGGYYFMREKPQKELEELVMQRNLLITSDANTAEEMVYYRAGIEGMTLHIYKMPENIIYDSVDLSSLQLTEDEKNELKKGITFNDLPEVFEFLENSMS